jgi:hypothetical protein
MGCKNGKVKSKDDINEKNKEKARDLFHKIDLENKNIIDPNECIKYW